MDSAPPAFCQEAVSGGINSRRCRRMDRGENPKPADEGGERRTPCPCSSPSIRAPTPRSEEHTSELQSLMRISYAVFSMKKKNKSKINATNDKSCKLIL